MPLVKNYMSCCEDQMMSIDVKWLNQKIVFYPRVATASGFVGWHCHLGISHGNERSISTAY